VTAAAALIAIAQRSRCPDCNSDVDYAFDQLGVLHLTIRHDDTCPTWRAIQKRTANLPRRARRRR
jgi:hypothetical protein